MDPGDQRKLKTLPDEHTYSEHTYFITARTYLEHNYFITARLWDLRTRICERDPDYHRYIS